MCVRNISQKTEFPVQNKWLHLIWTSAGQDDGSIKINLTREGDGISVSAVFCRDSVGRSGRNGFKTVSGVENFQALHKNRNNHANIYHVVQQNANKVLFYASPVSQRHFRSKPDPSRFPGNCCPLLSRRWHRLSWPAMTLQIGFTFSEVQFVF